MLSIISALILLALCTPAQANPLADILARMECLRAGNEWVDGECIKQEPPADPLDNEQPGPVEVKLAKKLTTQKIPLDRIGNLCLAWPKPQETSVFPVWSFYAALLIDKQWWTAQYHYKPDVCGPIGTAFFKGLRPLKQVIAGVKLTTKVFENVTTDHLRQARIFIAVLSANEETAYIKELVLELDIDR